MEGRIRVLMFVPQYPFPVVGGLEKQSHELAKALLASGVEVSALSGKVLPEQASREVVDRVRVTRLAWSRQSLVRMFTMPVSIAMAIWRARREFDTVHVHQHSWISVYVIALAKIMGKSTLAKLANVGDLGLPGMGRTVLGRLRRRILLSSDAVVAMSVQSIEELKACRFPHGRVLVTPNGITMAPISVKDEDRSAAAGRCRVVFVGRLTSQKQLHVLLEAWSSICRLLPNQAMLELWGEGELADALQQQSRALEITDHVRFLGHVTNVTDRLKTADIFVLPSLFEGNSNAILEAMVAGLPIVSTPVGGTAMQVGPVGANWLFPPGDVEALTRRLTTLIVDPELRRTVGAAMRERVRENFEIGVIAASYRRAYALLAAGRRDQVNSASNPVVTEVGSTHE